MSECIAIYTACGDRENAAAIARALIEEKLAACVQMSDVRSLYHWDGAVRDDAECLLHIKTRAALFEAAAARIRALHAYDTPEIIALPITAGDAAYLAWIRTQTGD